MHLAEKLIFQVQKVFMRFESWSNSAFFTPWNTRVIIQGKLSLGKKETKWHDKSTRIEKIKRADVSRR